jgi:hypothetical protein
MKASRDLREDISDIELTRSRDIYGRDYQVSQIDAQRLTHLLYAFAELSPNGTV